MTGIGSWLAHGGYFLLAILRAHVCVRVCACVLVCVWKAFRSPLIVQIKPLISPWSVVLFRLPFLSFVSLVGISAYPEKMGHPNSAAPVLRMGAFPAKAHPSQWYIHIHLKYRAAPNHQSWVLGLGSFNSFNMTTRVGNVI